MEKQFCLSHLLCNKNSKIGHYHSYDVQMFITILRNNLLKQKEADCEFNCMEVIEEINRLAGKNFQ